MTFRVQGEITINGAQAKAEAKAVAGELKKVAGDATGMATAGKSAAGAAQQLERGAAGAATDLRALAAAERQAAADAVVLGRNQTLAAGSIANLTAQFNDIGVMLAAGQNPLQLAIQQGTQITQVFGNMGAGAAVRALGTAFRGLFSLTNIATIGGIAAGAAVFQWLTGATEDAATFEDAIDDLTDQIDAYAAASKKAASSASDLRSEWGAASDEARRYLQDLAEIQRRETERASRQVATTLKDDIGIDSGSWRLDDRETLGDMFGVDLFGGVIMGGAEFSALLDEIVDGLDEIEDAKSIDAQIDAAKRLRDNFQQAAEAVGGITEEEDAALRKITEMILNLQRFKEEQRAAQAAIAEGNGRFPGFEAAKAALDYRLEEQIAIRASAAVAREMISTYQVEAEMRERIALFGRDAWLVAQSKLSVERESVAALVEAEGITGALAAEVMAAWDNANGFNAAGAMMATVIAEAYDAMVDLVGAAPGGGWLAGAIADADTLAGKLWDAAKAAAARINAERELSQMKFEFSPAGQALDKYGSRGTGSSRKITDGRGFELRDGKWVDPDARGRSGGRSGGGARSTRDEARAVEDLIQKLRDELALEREMDPVKREMIRYREELKDATAAERAEVEALIAQREREKAVTESLRWVGEQSGDALVDALMGAADAGERLIETLKRAVLQALLLGTGPLAGIFGGGLFGGGGFSLMGGLFDGGGLFAGLAEGGIVHGEGGPTDDKVPVRLSAGEFVVNAAATRRHRRLLEALNSAPGYATGGVVGGGSPPGGGGLGATTVNFHVDARGSQDPAAVEMAARRGMQQALTEFRRNQLPLDVRRAIDNPRVTRW